MHRIEFGRLSDGRTIELVTLANTNGMSVEILTYGGIVRSLTVPDRRGHLTNVVLGFADLHDYETQNPYFGAIIGRFANRLTDGTFSIDGTTYRVSVNDPPNSVHGGHVGFDKRVWSIIEHENACVTLGYTSPDGEEGFPGTLNVTVRYEVGEDNVLRIAYGAETDAPTVVNLTNHSYFNLASEGSGTVLGHIMHLDADRYLPIGETLMPTGEIRPVANTALDFTSPHTIGGRIRSGSPQIRLSKGYDHNYLLNRSTVEPSGLAFAARVTSPDSGRSMEIWTTETAIDFYSGNFLDGSLVGERGMTYRQGDGFAMEPEHPSDAPNLPDVESTVLRPGEIYAQTTEYRFGVESLP